MLSDIDSVHRFNGRLQHLSKIQQLRHRVTAHWTGLVPSRVGMVCWIFDGLFWSRYLRHFKGTVCHLAVFVELRFWSLPTLEDPYD